MRKDQFQKLVVSENPDKQVFEWVKTNQMSFKEFQGYLDNVVREDARDAGYEDGYDNGSYDTNYENTFC